MHRMTGRASDRQMLRALEKSIAYCDDALMHAAQPAMAVASERYSIQEY